MSRLDVIIHTKVWYCPYHGVNQSPKERYANCQSQIRPPDGETLLTGFLFGWVVANRPSKAASRNATVSRRDLTKGPPERYIGPGEGHDRVAIWADQSERWWCQTREDGDSTAYSKHGKTQYLNWGNFICPLDVWSHQQSRISGKLSQPEEDMMKPSRGRCLCCLLNLHCLQVMTAAWMICLSRLSYVVVLRKIKILQSIIIK